MLKSLPISQKLAAAFGIVILAAAATLGFVFFASSHVAELTEVNDRIDKEQALSAAVENTLLLAVADVRGFVVSHDPADLAAYENSMKKFEAAAGELAPMLQTAQDRALLQNTVDAAARWKRDTVQPMIAGMSQTDVNRAHAIAGSSGASRAVDDMTAGGEAVREEK